MVRDEARRIIFHPEKDDPNAGKSFFWDVDREDSQEDIAEEHRADVDAMLQRLEELGYLQSTNTFTTGTGQKMEGIHDETEDCATHGCVIHNPSDHTMKDFPTHWRDDRKLMERICPHGIGHPDPDDLAWKARTFGQDFANVESVHGCDGCCSGRGPSDES